MGRRTMVLKVAIAVAVVIAGVLLFAATRPNTFRIQRSLRIQAPPEKVFALINDLHNWSRWEPQDKEDPTMKRTFSGSESGVGAISEWSGRGSTGAGRMLITESVPPRKVSVKVDWARPFQAHNVNEFTLEPDGAFIEVTWRMQGSNVYIMKLMSIFVNMDHFMGKHFEAGLQNLKAAAEQ